MNKLKELSYRMKLRISLKKADDTILSITKEELKREYDRRQKRKNK